jgi:hypothetical protein
VVLATTDTITHLTAATTAGAIHMHREPEVLETPLDAFSGISGLDGMAVVAPHRGLAEFYPSDGQPLTALGPLAASMTAEGWDVWIVVPSGRMGDAHRALRGFPVMLQAWWDDGDRICFGGPEVA